MPQPGLNFWFEGGGYACMWSFGFAHAVKQTNLPINCIGGASGGALVSIFLANPNNTVEQVRRSVWEAPYSPAKGRFMVLGRHERNLAYMAEACLGSPIDFDPNVYAGKVWIPLRGLTCLSGTWRSRYRSYDDLIECIVATGCIPGMSGELSRCYLDDYGDRRGPNIDGGCFSYGKPKFWDPAMTLVVSPWGSGDLNMDPKPSWTDVACPAIDDLDRFFDLGYRQGQKFLSELPANRFTV